MDGVREKVQKETRSGRGAGMARACSCVRGASAGAAKGTADLGELACADTEPPG